MSLRLILFDVDGTLVDSQNDIAGAMARAFENVGQAAPTRGAILSIVGLSLPQAMARLAPDQDGDVHSALVAAYKSAYSDRRKVLGASHSSPLYPGALEMLTHLAAQPDYLLGVATGKSKRGLDMLIEAHGLEGMFVTRQVADHHPSKPHPSMIETAMAETGVARDATVMIGDTSFDMQMAHAAGVPGIGVSWGYHPPSALGHAHTVIDAFGALPTVLNQIWTLEYE